MCIFKTVERVFVRNRFFVLNYVDAPASEGWVWVCSGLAFKKSVVPGY